MWYYSLWHSPLTQLEALSAMTRKCASMTAKSHVKREVWNQSLTNHDRWHFLPFPDHSLKLSSIPKWQFIDLVPESLHHIFETPAHSNSSCTSSESIYVAQEQHINYGWLRMGCCAVLSWKFWSTNGGSRRAPSWLPHIHDPPWRYGRDASLLFYILLVLFLFLL